MSLFFFCDFLIANFPDLSKAYDCKQRPKIQSRGSVNTMLAMQTRLKPQRPQKKLGMCVCDHSTVGMITEGSLGLAGSQSSQICKLQVQ